MTRLLPLLGVTLGTTLAAGCTVAGPRPGEPSLPTPTVEVPEVAGAEPSVRVGLMVAVPSVAVGGTDRVELVDPAGQVLASGSGPWTIRLQDDRVAAERDGERVSAAGYLAVRPTGSGRVTADGRSYDGSVMLRAAGDGITVVNLLDLESYLLGVVPLEIGAGRPPEVLEAVKAQAIAARTYAVRHLGRREALGFDFHGSVEDQVYGGLDVEDEVASRAVRETRGEIIVHDGKPIEAFYHSTCGGRTAALEEVWDGEPRPYLRSVSDRQPGGGWFCESSNRFRWTEEWSGEELRSTLDSTLDQALADRGRSETVTTVRSLSLHGLTRSGRAAELRIETNLGEDRVAGDAIRRVLRPEPNRILNSTAIELHTEGRGEVTRLVVEGAGWGHGIGMCQVGALGRASAGHSYRDILTTYYPGTRIARLYR